MLIREVQGAGPTGMDIPDGFYEVTRDFRIEFGHWSVSFHKGDILRYGFGGASYVMQRFDPIEGKWVTKSPPISGTVPLQLSKYGYAHEQEKQLQTFFAWTRKVSPAEGKALASAQHDTLMTDGFETTAAGAMAFLKRVKADRPVTLKFSR